MVASFRPDIVLYDAGVDPHKDDSLGKLALTDEGLLRRDLQARCTLHAHACMPHTHAFPEAGTQEPRATWKLHPTMQVSFCTRGNARTTLWAEL